MRCLNFASHALGEGVKLVFLTCTSSAKTVIDDKGFECILTKKYKDVFKEIKSLKNKKNAKVILLDINYCSTIEQKHEYFYFLQQLKTLGLFLITFEDLSSDVFPADIVVIPYLGAESHKFQKKKESQYLLGPKYFPVREEFLKININQTPKENVKTILVTMGGSDPNQITKKVVKALSNLKLNVHLIIVLGYLSQLSCVQVKALLSNYGGSYKVIKDAKNMAKLMNESQLAITNSGLTKYEMANMGLPTIIITNSREYNTLMDDFASYGTAVCLGSNDDVTVESILKSVWQLINDRKKRKKMSSLGKQLVDGQGSERIFNYIPKY